MTKYYGGTSLPNLRAIGVKVDSGMPRQMDLAARSRLLAAAARVHVWAVPVFILIGETTQISPGK